MFRSCFMHSGNPRVTISPALSMGKGCLWGFFAPVPVPSDRSATAARPAVLYVWMRGRNALQSPIEIKTDPIDEQRLRFMKLDGPGPGKG